MNHYLNRYYEKQRLAKELLANRELMRYCLNRESYYEEDLRVSANEGSLEKFIFDKIVCEHNTLMLKKLEVLSMFIIPDISKIILEYAVYYNFTNILKP